MTAPKTRQFALAFHTALTEIQAIADQALADQDAGRASFTDLSFAIQKVGALCRAELDAVDTYTTTAD